MNESIVIDTLLQGHRPPLTPDVFRLEPAREFLGVLDGRAQGKDLGPRVDLSQLGEGYLECRSPIRVVDEMDLVGDDDGESLQPVGFVSKEAICSFRGCDDDIEAFEVWVNRIVVSYANADFDSEGLELL